MAYNDIEWIKDKVLWSQKIKNLLYHIGLGNLWEEAHFSDIGIVRGGGLMDTDSLFLILATAGIS